MNHNKLQKYLLLYLDGELTKDRRHQMDVHLERCSDCRNKLARMRQIYQESDTRNRLKVSPFLYTRVRARWLALQQGKTHTGLYPLSVKLQPLMTAALLMAAVFCGYLLGSASIEQEQPQEMTFEQVMQETLGMEVFDPNPPQSLGRVVMMLYEKPHEVLP